MLFSTGDSRISATSSLYVRPMIRTLDPLIVFPTLFNPLTAIFRDILRHGIIDGSPGKNDLRVIADFLGFLNEVIRIIQGYSDLLPYLADRIWKFHLVPAALSTSSVSMPSPAKIMEISFISAIFRSRWIFSMTFACFCSLDIRCPVYICNQPVQV